MKRNQCPTASRALAGILAAFSLLACEGSQTSLGVTPKTVSVNAEGGSVQVAFSATMDWTASTSADWISLSPSSGTAGDIVMTVTVQKNSSTSPRSTVVTVSMPSIQVSDVVTVSQEAAAAIPDPSFSLSAHETVMGAEGGSAQLTVKTNQTWSARSSGNWITVTPEAGIAGEMSIILTVAANPALEPREGEITFTAGPLTDVFKLTQYARKPASVTLSSDAFIFPAEGGLNNLVISANVAWTAQSGDVWLKITPAEGIAGAVAAVVEASAYEGEDARTGTITFSGGDASATLFVTQLAPVKTDDPVLELSASTLSFPDSAGSNEISVIGNVSWNAVSDAGWLTVTPAQGQAGNVSVTITVTANTAASDRGGKVSFISGNLVRTLIVNQKGKVSESAPTIDLSPVSLTFSTEGGTAEISLSADAAWSASADATWISVNPARAEAGTRAVKVTAARNESSNDRSGAVVFTAGNTSVRLSVSQKGRGQQSLGGITGELGNWADGGSADFNKNN